MRQREFRCSCGYALLIVESAGRPPQFFEDANSVSSCPRCTAPLDEQHAIVARNRDALALLQRARAGEQLEPDEHRQLATALGLEPVVLGELLEQVRDRRQAVVVAAAGQVHRLNGTPPA